MRGALVHAELLERGALRPAVPVAGDDGVDRLGADALLEGSERLAGDGAGLGAGVREDAREPGDKVDWG